MKFPYMYCFTRTNPLPSPTTCSLLFELVGVRKNNAALATNLNYRALTHLLVILHYV